MAESSGVPVKWLGMAGAVLAVLAVLGLVFYGGMRFERNRLESELSTFTKLRDKQEKATEELNRPVQLTIGTPVRVESRGAPVLLTLESTALDYSEINGRVRRFVQYSFAVENLGRLPRVLSTFEGHFENSLGRPMDIEMTDCFEEPEPPVEPIEPGQIVRGCESLAVSGDSGRIVFDKFTPNLYIDVEAD